MIEIDGKEQIIPAKTVLIAAGTKPNINILTLLSNEEEDLEFKKVFTELIQGLCVDENFLEGSLVVR